MALLNTNTAHVVLWKHHMIFFNAKITHYTEIHFSEIME